MMYRPRIIEQNLHGAYKKMHRAKWTGKRSTYYKTQKYNTVPFILYILSTLEKIFKCIEYNSWQVNIDRMHRANCLEHET